MRRASRQGLAKEVSADPAVLKRDPQYGHRPLSERGSRAAECKPQLVGLSVVCFVLFCSVVFWFAFLILICLVIVKSSCSIKLS